MQEKIHCENCGALFAPKSHNSKYCSNCKYNKSPIKKCKRCGKIFETTNLSVSLCLDCRYDFKLKTGFRIFKRDNFTCVYCGKNSIDDGIKLVVDHIIPVKKGGSGNLDNLITSCKSCNESKNDILLNDDIIKKLISKSRELNKTLSDQEIIELSKFYRQKTKYRQSFLS